MHIKIRKKNYTTSCLKSDEKLIPTRTNMCLWSFVVNTCWEYKNKIDFYNTHKKYLKFRYITNKCFHWVYSEVIDLLGVLI